MARPMRPLLLRPSCASQRLLSKRVNSPTVLAARRHHSSQPHTHSARLPRPSHLCATSYLPSRGRTYHSYDHPAPPSPFSATETTILSAAYTHVPEHGFTQHTLALGARDAGYLDISTNILPNGVFSLIRYHLTVQREALAGRAAVMWGAGDAQAQAQAQERPLSVAKKVEALTWERLMGNREVIGRWQEALAVMAQPSYVPASVKELALLADEIWFVAGDVSVDPSWYTKRATLSGIYGASELFMTNDRSEGFLGTRDFLRRRFCEVNDLGGYVRSVSEWVGFTANAGVNILRSKGGRI